MFSLDHLAVKRLRETISNHPFEKKHTEVENNIAYRKNG